MRTYPRHLLFGLCHTAGSGYGQTFFVALFATQICQEFQVATSTYGAIYSGATLASALIFPWSGALIDRVDILKFSRGVALLLAIACGLMAAASNTWMLFGAMAALRHGGQALMSHTGIVATARFFSTMRGKALSICNLGFIVGEATIPTLVVALESWMSWQQIFVAAGISMIVLFIPAMSVLAPKEASFLKVEPSRDPKSPSGHSVRRQVLGTRFFWLALPASLACPGILTGFIFMQSYIGELRGWSPLWMASAFSAFALSRLPGSFLSGPLIDRMSAKHLLALHLVPMALGLLGLGLMDDPIAIWICWIGGGLSTGFGANIKQAMWAEEFGTARLGTVKSMLGPIVVFSTAVGPPLFPFLIERRWTLAQVVWLSLAFVAFSFICAVAAGKTPNAEKPSDFDIV